MRIGQTSFVVFVSKLVGSALGFVATVYFARTLGATVLGYYALVIAVVAWLKLGGTLGITSAIVKRVSEGEEPAAYFAAGAVAVGTFGLVLSVVVLAFGDLVNGYVGAPVAPYVVVLLLVGLLGSLVTAGLKGQRRVHVAGLLEPVKIGTRSLVQVALVVGGFGLIGMLVGHAVGGLLVALVGVALLSVGIARPRRRHFERLFEFAKFSWLGGLKSRSFNDVDVLVLGALVPSSLVGVYTVAWSIAQFLTLFGGAVSTTLFPELSRADATDDRELVAGLIRDSLAYGGLIIVPGLFGGAVLGERLLRIYGDEFTQGTTVLALLILASLVYGYQTQLMNALNAIDRPDVAFRINAVFIATNFVLNVALISWIGWVGAALATVLSAALGLVLAYSSLRGLVDVEIPTGELTRQFVAAAVMAGLVRGVLEFVERTTLLQHNFLLVVSLVGIGSLAYFATLLAISREFRTTVAANAPVALSFAGGADSGRESPDDRLR